MSKYSRLYVILCAFIIPIYSFANINKPYKQKVLMNAEAFGFGPSSAIAQFFPFLRKHIDNLSYIGQGHSLHLHKQLPYDAIFDYHSKEEFCLFAKEYDVLITATDFKAAKWAKELGLKVIIYDPLTWYWKTIPKEIQQADLYIAQNFFGVEEKLATSGIKNYFIIPPLTENSFKANSSEDYLINLGGLSNPYLDNKDLSNYSQVICKSIASKIDSKIYCACNNYIAKDLQSICDAKSYLPQDLKHLIATAKIAFMTSGLGNIIEASAFHKYVIWLPPTNDSQGQQLYLLKSKNMIDNHIDWHHIIDDIEPINYFDSQEKVMRNIQNCLKQLNDNQKLQHKFQKKLIAAYIKAFLSLGIPPKLSYFAKEFGTCGDKQGANIILQYIKQCNTLHK